MAVLKTREAPDPVLNKVSRPVRKFNAAVRRQMDDMLDTMYASHVIGIAANQVGLLNRVLVMDLGWKSMLFGRKDNPVCMANPEIVWRSGSKWPSPESCLSLSWKFALVARSGRVRVKYIDRDGQDAELEARGLTAFCIQHEIDHLNGVLMTDPRPA